MVARHSSRIAYCRQWYSSSDEQVQGDTEVFCEAVYATKMTTLREGTIPWKKSQKKKFKANYKV